jgi:putative oxidoreductase
MKIVHLLARLLLGLIFLVFGLNGFLNFIPSPMPTGLAGQFIIVLSQSHYATVVFALQLIGAILLLVNRYVPLGLTLLAPIIVNIILFHVFMSPSGLPLAAVTTVLWGIAAYPARSNFAGLFDQRVPS